MILKCFKKYVNRLSCWGIRAWQSNAHSDMPAITFRLDSFVGLGNCIVRSVVTAPCARKERQILRDSKDLIEHFMLFVNELRQILSVIESDHWCVRLYRIWRCSHCFAKYKMKILEKNKSASSSVLTLKFYVNKSCWCNYIKYKRFSKNNCYLTFV